MMLGFDEIEALISPVLPRGNEFTLDRRVDKRYLFLTIRRRLTRSEQDGSSRTEALLATSGVEAFFLTLDESWETQDFEWRPEAQRKMVLLFGRLAVAYLEGSGIEREWRSWLGRHHRELVLDIGGESYVFSRRRG